ncbi:HD-GYP domain-containing protein [Azohydromonas lata]|uniref:Uncharacterized protein n=1 Tax=Azohydromonas lata TaxID=45677 RepID=A0ABU5I867_9BURK|nr:hypothetical protein [Azohydromonas lata]MDZ5455284.1 hypothetical protein [Azohydromonas lata]
MKLVPLSTEHVDSQKKFPFDLFDANGQLLVAANEPLDNPSVRQRLRLRGAVFAEAQGVQAWRCRLMQAADELVRRNEPLTRIARVVPKAPKAFSEDAEPRTEWNALVHRLDAALAQAEPGSPWLKRVLEVHAHAHSLALQRLDEGLFHLFYQGARHAADYSSRQALRCMLVAGAVARTLGWDAAHIEVVEKAALTMNVAMRRLQDCLALHPAAEIDKDLREQLASRKRTMFPVLADDCEMCLLPSGSGGQLATAPRFQGSSAS